MKTTIYSKYSNDRNRRFSIRTDILEDENGNRLVRKVPAFEEAKGHVANLGRWYEILSAQAEGTRLSFDRCTPSGDCMELEYLAGDTLEAKLLTVLHRDGIDACAKSFVECLQFLRDLHTGAEFEPGEAFREVFGEAAPKAGSICAPCTDIDLLCENIIVNNDSWTAIDYEWTFDFPIPVNYLLYRIILHFTDHANRGEEFRRYDFMGQMGITKNEQDIYAAMEAHFQQYILQEHVPIRNLYDDISQGIVMPEDFSGYESLQIYNNTGDGFSEDTSVFYPMHYADHWTVSCTHPVTKDILSLRIDPGFHSCMVHLNTFHFDNQASRAEFTVREGSILGDWIFFSEDDPNLFIGTIPKGASSLLISYDLYDADPGAMEEIRQQTITTQLLKEQAEVQTKQIKELARDDKKIQAQIDQLNKNLFIRIGGKLHGRAKAGNRRKED